MGWRLSRFSKLFLAVLPGAVLACGVLAAMDVRADTCTSKARNSEELCQSEAQKKIAMADYFDRPTAGQLRETSAELAENVGKIAVAQSEAADKCKIAAQQCLDICSKSSPVPTDKIGQCNKDKGKGEKLAKQAKAMNANSKAAGKTADSAQDKGGSEGKGGGGAPPPPPPNGEKKEAKESHPKEAKHLKSAKQSCIDEGGTWMNYMGSDKCVFFGKTKTAIDRTNPSFTSELDAEIEQDLGEDLESDSDLELGNDNLVDAPMLSDLEAASPAKGHLNHNGSANREIARAVLNAAGSYDGLFSLEQKSDNIKDLIESGQYCQALHRIRLLEKESFGASGQDEATKLRKLLDRQLDSDGQPSGEFGVSLICNNSSSKRKS